MPNQSEILKRRLFDSVARPWQDLLPEAKIEALLSEKGIRYRNRLYTPIVTLWAVVYQVLCVALRSLKFWMFFKYNPKEKLYLRGKSSLKHRSIVPMHDSVLEARLVMKSYSLHLLFKSCVSGLDFPIPMQSLQIKLEIPEPTVPIGD